MINELQELKDSLAKERYICDDNLAAALFVSLSLSRPLLVEGAAGVGKTEVAKVMSTVLKRELVRLQCHAGMDETRSLYEWNYQKQLLAIQANAASGKNNSGEIMQSIFAEEFLFERPLLRSIRSTEPVVLLIDEVDKTDEEFEAFLLELLAEFQITIPELGTVSAVTQPFVVLTSNNTRPLSDALRRRCVYVFLQYPSIEKELQIIHARMPDVPEALAVEVAQAVAYLRSQAKIIKKPSIAETLDWIAALEAMGAKKLTRDAAFSTIGAVVKTRADMEVVENDDNFIPLH